MKSRILLIGPIKNRKNPKLTGGAIVLFEQLLQELNKNDLNYILVDSNKKNYQNIFLAYISIYSQIFIKQFRANHISIHSSQDYIYLTPFIIILAKTFKKEVSLRKFGGEAWNSYIEEKGLKQFILRNIFKNVNYLFLEMKFLVKKFKEINPNTYWFPNVRNRPKIDIQRKKFSKRFVFIGHIKKAKGINEIVKVRSLLDSSYTIDIYGTINDIKYTKEYFEKQNLSYKGSLLPEDVLSTLSTYDVLLLPSWKEGYPGIIIESYSIGIPIIATNLRGISEITDEYKSGILIKPKDVKALKNAIEYFTQENYEEMALYAKAKFTMFDGEKQSKKFIEIIDT
jgi:glycosyltransferase involved in cell wall biosynthesis